MTATVAAKAPPATPAVLRRELSKPIDAADLTDLETARLEAMSLRALLRELLRLPSVELERHVSFLASEDSQGSTTGDEEDDDDEEDEDRDEDWKDLRTDPEVALRRLQVGNARFVAGLTHRPHIGPRLRRRLASHGQMPFCTVLGCSDSRAPVPVLFDAGVGDIFCVNVAGNVVSEGALASVEYGVGYLKTPLLLVLGHTHCGAVTACVQNQQCKGCIPKLLSLIEPACCMAQSQCCAAASPADPAVLVRHAIEANVMHSVAQLLVQSEVVRQAALEGKVSVQGALFHLHSGSVQILGPHPNQAALLREDEEVPLMDGPAAALESPRTAPSSPFAKTSPKAAAGGTPN